MCIRDSLYGSSEKLGANTADTGFAVSQTKAPAGYTLLRVLSSGDVLSLGVLGSDCSTLPTDSGGYGKSRDFKYCSLGIERAGTPAVSIAYPCQEAGVNTMTCLLYTSIRGGSGFFARKNRRFGGIFEKVSVFLEQIAQF